MPKARRKPSTPAMPAHWYDTGPETEAQMRGAELRVIKGDRAGGKRKFRSHEIDRLHAAGHLSVDQHRIAEAMLCAYLLQFTSPSGEIKVDRTPQPDLATVLQVHRMDRYARLVAGVPDRCLYAVRCVIERGHSLWTLCPTRNLAKWQLHLCNLHEALDAVDC